MIPIVIPVLARLPIYALNVQVVELFHMHWLEEHVSPVVQVIILTAQELVHPLSVQPTAKNVFLPLLVTNVWAHMSILQYQDHRLLQPIALLVLLASRLRVLAEPLAPNALTFVGFVQVQLNVQHASTTTAYKRTRLVWCVPRDKSQRESHANFQNRILSKPSSFPQLSLLYLSV